MNTEKKYRNELKYICTEAELRILETRIKAVCKKDPHVGSDGTYDIRSIYFDDLLDTCFKENEAGTDPRSKFRIRIYNGDSSRITLEKKSKTHGMTSKNSARLTKEQFERIMSKNPRDIFAQNGLIDSHISDDKALLNEFETKMLTSGLSPKVVVAYRRTPFIYNAGNVRITFDRNIGHTTNFDSFFDKDIPLLPVLANGTHILEVKYDELIPDFLYSLLNLDNLIYTNFSKYYLSRHRM